MLLASSPAARAQFIGGAAPAGTDTLNFTVPGVGFGNNGFAFLVSMFTCTNPTATTVNVGVELFDKEGWQMSVTPALPLPPGGTRRFSTGNAWPIAIADVDQMTSPVGYFPTGAPKIWSNSKSLHCHAALMASGIGEAQFDLPVIAKGKKQKGD